MITINVELEPAYHAEIATKTLIAVANSTLNYFQVTQGELTVVVTTDEAVQSLNHTYRQVDAPTDVLSFAASEVTENTATFPPDMPDFVLPDEGGAYLGDIIIAFPTATRQAEIAGHSVAEEVCLLVIHGVLHLLGFDHDTPQAKAPMWQAQQDILHLNDLTHVKPTE
jgi:probable rRNA maturation factor